MGTIDASDAISGEVWEDTGVDCLARVVGHDGDAITQSDVESIARKVFDLSGSTPGTAVDTSAPAVASTVYDTLQTDSRWTEDSTGYNVADTVEGSVLDTGNHRYRVEYVFTPTSGEKYAVVFDIYTKALRSS